MHGMAESFKLAMVMMTANPAPMGTIMNSTVALYKLVTLFFVSMATSIFVVFNMKWFYFILKKFTIKPPLNFKNVIMSSIGTHKIIVELILDYKNSLKKLELITITSEFGTEIKKLILKKVSIRDGKVYVTTFIIVF